MMNLLDHLPPSIPLKDLPMIPDRAIRCVRWFALSVASALIPNAQGDELVKDPDIGKSCQVPYVLSATNHFIVRVKLNGKGPFNLVVDTGAPALYLSTEAAEKAGLKPERDEFFCDVDTLEIEGGAKLSKVQARVEDIFQLVGMNALGLPGVRIDGMLGFNVLARYRITIDPTADRMTWTRLDHEPATINMPKRDREKAKQEPEVQALDLLGGVAKVAAIFLGKQPEDKLIPRGFVGIELAEADGSVKVQAVLAESPAAVAGVKVGDRLVEVLGREIKSLKDVAKAIAKVEPGDKVTVELLGTDAPADSEPREIDVVASEGL
jgi:PDZ domain/Aspartyl protease